MSLVTLVGVTKSTLPGVDTVEDLVAYAARVSNPTNQANSETAPRILRYLMKNQHWSPFEMVSLTMEITTTRDIARQILRHRSFAFQEFSQRYASAESLGFETREARMQDEKNRQASLEATDLELSDMWQEKQHELLRKTREVYAWALSNGIAKEQARAVLPEGNTQSRLYMAGTLRSWLHYCILRTEIGTQKEHRIVAEQCFDIVKLEFPSIAELFINKD
jgi:thymidylate synthase (FAD)